MAHYYLAKMVYFSLAVTKENHVERLLKSLKIKWFSYMRQGKREPILLESMI